MGDSLVSENDKLIDYKLLRLIVGAVGLSLGLLVNWQAGWDLPSISDSYHDSATRDFFVGSLCFIGAFLTVYKGHPPKPTTFISEAVLSKIAGISAIVVAFVDNKEWLALHFAAAALVFIILSYFCLFSFRKQAAGKTGAMAVFRVCVYTVSGLVMIACLLIIGLHAWKGIPSHRNTVYWGETIALIAFGISWVVASQGAAIEVKDNVVNKFRRK